jgi:hypothetical protein
MCGGGCGSDRAAPDNSVPELPTGGDPTPVGGETRGSESSQVLDGSSEEGPSARASNPSGGSRRQSGGAGKPLAGDGSVSGGAGKPLAGDGSASGDDNGPSAGDSKPPAGEDKPPTGDNKQPAEDNKPLAGGPVTLPPGLKEPNMGDCPPDCEAAP